MDFLKNFKIGIAQVLVRFIEECWDGFTKDIEEENASGYGFKKYLLREIEDYVNKL